MLSSLFIRNIATAKEINIDFKEGLSVITGETGAGKSVIVESIGAVFGNKLSRDFIREGESSAVVSALFTDLDDSLIAEISGLGIFISDGDNSLSIQREFTSEGKTSNRINGKSVSQTLLRETTKFLLNIHNQYDSQILLHSENHIELLDNYSELNNLLADYAESYDKMTSLKSEINGFKGDDSEKQRAKELIAYQINDIDKAKLRENEEEKLIELKKYIQNMEKIAQNIAVITDALTDSDEGYSAVAQIQRAVAAISSIGDFIPDAVKITEKLERMESEIFDISERVRDAVTIDEDNPTAKLDKIERRLEQISKLKRKYGSTVAEITAYRQKLAADLDNIVFAGEKLEKLQEEYDKVKTEAEKKANVLHEARKKSKTRLEKRIMDELSYLDMKNVIFEIDIQKRVETDGGVSYTPRGCDRVEFLIATNTGDTPKSLGKIVSGGELSRIMLALKSVFAVKDNVKTIIFDEIDTGISGKTAYKIGEKLRDIAEVMQVISVTHSAQIASLADVHYQIKKTTSEGRAVSNVKILNRDERIKEVARIMGGVTISETLLATAAEMISSSERNLASVEGNISGRKGE